MRYRVRAVDRNGQAGDWRSSDWTIRDGVVGLVDRDPLQRDVVVRELFDVSQPPGALDETRSASATYTFDGASVAWAGPVGPTRGQARVIVDGRLVATVDTYRATFKARDVIWAAALTDGQHTLRIQVLGTAGRPTVAVDGMYVLRAG